MKIGFPESKVDQNLRKSGDEFSERLPIISPISFLPGLKDFRFYNKLNEKDRFQMTKDNFPYIAAILGLVLIVIVYKGSGVRDDGKTLIPLLTLLLMCEFGAIVTTVGTYFGGKHFLATREISGHTAVTLLCVVLCIQFIVHGFRLWTH